MSVRPLPNCSISMKDNMHLHFAGPPVLANGTCSQCPCFVCRQPIDWEDASSQRMRCEAWQLATWGPIGVNQQQGFAWAAPSVPPEFVPKWSLSAPMRRVAMVCLLSIALLCVHEVPHGGAVFQTMSSILPCVTRSCFSGSTANLAFSNQSVSQSTINNQSINTSTHLSSPTINSNPSHLSEDIPWPPEACAAILLPQANQVWLGLKHPAMSLPCQLSVTPDC